MPVYRFGGFELSTEARSLRLAGRDVPAQPLVFDFLACLAARADRAVGKDEIMDALWPSVTVTEASLQRVASLARATLRKGGCEQVLRNLPRFGYRLEAEVAPPGVAADAAPASDDPLERAHAAVAGRRWAEAVTAFREADRDDRLATEDLEALASALECAGRLGEAAEPLARAVTALCMSGQRRRAAGPALFLSRVHLEKGETAVASGWHRRAGELVGEDRDSRDYGLWCWMGGRIAAANEKPELALELSEAAYEVGRRTGDPVVESLGLIYRGFFRVCLGDIEPGIADQDLAAALGLSSDIDPIVGCILFCNVLWACRNSADWGRAAQWSDSYIRWCEASGMGELTGPCRLHHAEVIGVQGGLARAETLVGKALAQLANDAPWAIGDGYRVLGDIRRWLGDAKGAEAAYQEALAHGWDAQPGLALLHLAQGNGEAARLSLERSIGDRSWAGLMRRSINLATLAKVAARTGHGERAGAILAEIEAEPGRFPMLSVRAIAAEARAELMVAEGRRDEAAGEMRRACALWTSADSPLDAADCRLRLADLLLATGDPVGAGTEAAAACLAARRAGAAGIIAGCRAIEEALAGQPAAG